MSNNQYNDKERLHIAKQQYIIYEKGAQILTADKKKTIGYVSEVKGKLSGENTYIVTDIKLSDNPTQEEFSKVGHVTVLYQGSTFELSKPVETAVDWLVNDAVMATRIIVPDFVPTRPSIQLRDASKTLQETFGKYPNATISIYGHSLGSMNAQNAISDVSAKYDDRISGVYLYHGPNVYKTLNSQQRENDDWC